MTPRITRLRTELGRLEDVAVSCHPCVQDELLSLIEDVRAHLNELETAAASGGDEAGSTWAGG